MTSGLHLVRTLIARHARKEPPMLYAAGAVTGLVILVAADVCARACHRFRHEDH